MTTFHSTRSTTDSLTSKQAIRKGIADDGGLFVTDSLGETHVDIASLAGKSYQQIAFDVLSVLLPDYTEAELKECIDEAYGPQWSDEKITPVKPLSDDYVMELFNGPTSAFKDVALQILPRFMARTTPADGDADEKIMIVTATSGDTGKAALAGFADAAGTGITVFYPEGKVSQVQELQMTTQSGSNVNVCAVKGNFDDAQSAVKRIFGDKELAERLADDSHVVLSSANSINVGRLVPQVVYYFSAYAQLLERQVINVGDEVEFVVPTGNFGDILAGWYAKQMGLPVGKLVCASNANNVLTDFIRTGTYDKNRPFHTTASPSMDILVSSNLERLLYALCGSDTEVAGYMQQLREQGGYTVSDELKAKIRATFAGGFCNDIQTREKIGRAWRDHRYLIDTHTAVAYHVLDEYRCETGDAAPAVVVSTASPFKFCDQVLRGIGGTADAFGPELIRRLTCETQIDAPAPLTGLDARPVRFGGCVDKTQMLHTVDEFLK